MTIEKLQFQLPAVFTIGPEDDKLTDRLALRKYVKILGGGPSQGASHDHILDICRGIIEGETRVIVSGMTMEEIFKERQVFKSKVIEHIQSELNQFGLKM